MARKVIQKTCGTGSKDMADVSLRAGEQEEGNRGRNGGVVLLEHLFPMKDETKKQPSDVHGWRRGRYSTSKQVHAEVNRS